MTGRLQLIEQKILGLEGGPFQRLCDVFLIRRLDNLISFERIGSKLGKQKTTKGTPDTYYRLGDGSLRCVEFTTTEKDLVIKLKKDIDSCLDFKKTKISINEIGKIVLCFNTKLKIEKEVEVLKYAQEKNIEIELIGLGRLALEICFKHPAISKEFLGIPLNTGQLLPLPNFISEYNHKGGNISTPLDNKFLNRENELIEIESQISTSDMVILTGDSGVGKTKLGLESVQKFIAQNSDFQGFAVSNKSVEIFEDLKIQLEHDKNYIILIDDANRQLPNFHQILGIFKEKRIGKIKLLITVRQYALKDILSACKEFEPALIDIKKFTDDEIREIIGSDSFNILDFRYQQKIIEIANGNARLAVMAARYANEFDIKLLEGTIEDLYDKYFQRLIDDNGLFKNPVLLKTIGILSFFQTIDKRNKNLFNQILTDFKIKGNEFHEAIYELERKELVETQHDILRISEQILSTYFFYLVFIKNQFLPFRTLLFNYYHSHRRQFYDLIIPIGDAFGYDFLSSKINLDLADYWKTIQKDEKSVLDFFQQFWFFRTNDMLTYFFKKIKKLPEPNEPAYEVNSKKSSYMSDKLLDLISNCFYNNTTHFKDSIEIGFEYARKKPELLSELVQRINGKLLFTERDFYFQTNRQEDFFEVLNRNFKDRKPHFVSAYFPIVEAFFSHEFKERIGNSRDKVMIHNFKYPTNEKPLAFRKSLWESLFDSFDDFPSEVVEVLKKVKNRLFDFSPELLEFDIEYFVKIVDEKFDTSNFHHIHFVHDFDIWLKRKTFESEKIQNLVEKFRNERYEILRRLNWSSVGGRHDFEVPTIAEFRKLKKEDIQKTLMFENENENDFFDFIQLVKIAYSLDGFLQEDIHKTLDIILTENFKRDAELGFRMLELLFANYPEKLWTLGDTVSLICKTSKEYALRLFKMLDKWKNGNAHYWKLSLFYALPKDIINSTFEKKLIQCVQSSAVNTNFLISNLKNFIELNEKLPFQLLKIITRKNEKEENKIYVFAEFYKNYPPTSKVELELFKQSYLQQETLHWNFDHDRTGLKSVLKLDHSFLNDLISLLFDLNNNPSPSKSLLKRLNFIWEFKNYQVILNEAINLLVEKYDFAGITENPINAFFENLSEESKVKAEKFVLDFISKNNVDRDKMNAMVDVLRHQFHPYFEKAFSHYLSVNTNVEDFQKIRWIGLGGFYKEKVNVSEVRGSKWQNLLFLASQAENQFELIPIKNFLKEKVERHQADAERERRRKIMHPF